MQEKEIEYLNLYACLGGNRALLPGSVKVTAVEIDPKIAEEYAKLYPLDKIIVGDAHEYLRKNVEKFDFIWSSPPCPTHSRLNLATRHKLHRYPDMKLYQEIIYLSTRARSFYCVENVVPYYEPLIKAQKIGRHLFWSNFRIRVPETLHKKVSIIKDFNGKGGREKAMQWLGIYVEKVLYQGKNHDPVQVFRNMVHPELGLHIFNCAMGVRKPSLQQELF